MYRQNYPDDPGMHNREPLRYGGRQASHQTLTEKLKSYFLSVVVGFLLICIGCGLLFWNEGRTVQTYKSLEEGLAQIRSLDSEVAMIEENNNKLIHITGFLRTQRPLFDSEYGVEITAVKLKRVVEMFQWVEHEHKREIQELDRIRNEVSYSYSQEWKNHLVNSNSFEKRSTHHNPESFPVNSYVDVAKEVQVGSFYLSQNLIDKINDFKKLNLFATNSSKHLNVWLRESMFYHSADPDSPQVGDMRVWFEYAGLSGASKTGPPQEVSIIGRQSRNTVTGFQTRSGDVLEMIYIGSLTAEEIFHREEASNVFLSWGLRFLGWLLIFIAFTLTTNFISALVSWLPVVRDIVALGVLIMCLSLSISISLTVIALGWVWYRPLLGFTILAFAALPFLLARFQRRQARGSRTDRIW